MQTSTLPFKQERAAGKPPAPAGCKVAAPLATGPTPEPSLPCGANTVFFPPVSEVTKKRVVLGMSGGVDSSAAAALLIQQGWDVIGITLKLWPQDCVSRAEDKCCGPQAVTDARSVAHKLNIPYYLVD